MVPMMLMALMLAVLVPRLVAFFAAALMRRSVRFVTHLAFSLYI
jgi:hypothetical protein